MDIIYRARAVCSMISDVDCILRNEDSREDISECYQRIRENLTMILNHYAILLDDGNQ
jgi:hypothetical protein